MSVSAFVGRQAVAIAGALLLAGAAFAQAPAPAQEEPKNLTVLPKDMTRPQVIQVMQNFSAALGVGCDHCHVANPGMPPDFASDDKKEKDLARAMMKITQDLNTRLPMDFGMAASDVTRVGCVTCHRGVPLPKQLSEILAKTSADQGFPAASTQYNELKSKYYGAQAYDFTDAGLIATATPLIATRTDEAIQFLQMSAQLFPQSARTYVSLAQAQQAKRDTPAAIVSLEKALAIDPRNAQATRMLADLKK